MEKTCPKTKEKKSSPSKSSDARELLSKLPGIRLITKNPNPEVKVIRNKPRQAKMKPKTTTSNWQQSKFFFLCSKCPQIFSTQTLLDAHAEKCNVSEYLQKKISPKNSLLEPYHFDRFKNVYVCKKCQQEFDFKSAVEEHLKTTHPGFSCHECKATFGLLVDLGYHSSKHHPSQTMSCPRCAFKTNVKPKLAFHIQTEHSVDTNLMSVEDVNFTCVVCSKTFYNSRKLAHHQKNYHKASVDIEPSMGARLSEPTVRSQTTEPLLCDTCGKNFSSKYRLERHQRAMHQGLKPYVCGYCGRAFTGKDTMKKHERIHTGEKPYSCEYCGKCFRQPGPFAVHLRIHTGERPYKCRYCKKGFITNQTNKAHMKNCVKNSIVKIPDVDFNYMFVPPNEYC